MIEVFKTNIIEESIADSLQNELLALFPEFVISFDLEDCDRILRIENCRVPAEPVMHILREKGYHCEILE